MADKPVVTTALDGTVEMIVGGDRYSNRTFAPVMHTREMVGLTGTLAMRLVEHYGLISAMPDGEDNSGRQKGALMPPDAAVERAVTIAELMVAKLRERGHTFLAPSAADFYDQDKPD